MLLTATAETAIETLAEVTGNENLKPGVIQNYLKDLPDKAFALLVKVVFAIIVIVIMWQAIKAITNLVEKSLKKTKIEDATAKFLASVVKVSLEVFLAFSIAAGFGMDTASIVALLGSAGVAIGLAVQGTLSNLAGGVMILLVKPFRLGDYIIEDSHKHEGTVKEISLFTTKLITPDNRVIIIPNGELSNTSLTNSTGNKVRLLQVFVGIPYSESINKARTVLEGAMNSSKYALKDREMLVVVNDFKDSCIEMQLRCWVKAYDYIASKWDLNERVKNALDEAGIEIPFNQIDVHMKQG
jgi:small conductance mechanosensitive channel